MSQSHVTANATTGDVKTVSRPDIIQNEITGTDDEMPAIELEDQNGIFYSSDVHRTLNWCIARIDYLIKGA